MIFNFDNFLPYNLLILLENYRIRILASKVEEKRNINGIAKGCATLIQDVNLQMFKCDYFPKSSRCDLRFPKSIFKLLMVESLNVRKLFLTEFGEILSRSFDEKVAATKR